MSHIQNLSYAIEEVSTAQSQYLTGMNRWLEQLFPEYCPSRFDTLLTKLRKNNGQHQIQIFIGLSDNKVVSLIQLFYREWQGGLLADIDLLGTLEPFRRNGIALALLDQSLLATREIARQYKIPAIGITSLIDPHYAPIMKLHQKQGGQIREDSKYSSGDIIVWYPQKKEYEGIPTSLLIEQLQQFGQLLHS